MAHHLYWLPRSSCSAVAVALQQRRAPTSGGDLGIITSSPQAEKGRGAAPRETGRRPWPSGPGVAGPRCPKSALAVTTSASGACLEWPAQHNMSPFMSKCPHHSSDGTVELHRQRPPGVRPRDAPGLFAPGCGGVLSQESWSTMSDSSPSTTSNAPGPQVLTRHARWADSAQGG